jgi:hypothetical protein
MSLYEGLSLVVSAAGFLALVVSIRYLIEQTRQVALQSQGSARALESNTFDASAVATFMVNSIFIEHPDLRKYFYDGEEQIQNESDRDRVLAIAELMLDYFDYVLLQQRRSPILHPHNFWSEEYLIDSFSASPILCEYLRQKMNWYSNDLAAVMHQGIDRRRVRSGWDPGLERN